MTYGFFYPIFISACGECPCVDEEKDECKIYEEHITIEDYNYAKPDWCPLEEI